MDNSWNRKSEANDGESIRLIVPEESLIAVEMRIDGKPYVGIFNKGLSGFNHKDVFGWYLSVIIDYDRTVGDGMPDEDDSMKMQDFSDALTEELAGDQVHPNALFFGRVTGDGYTQIMWYVNDPAIADKFLKGLIDSKAYPFEFEYEMTHDPTWEEAAYWQV